MYTSFYNLKSKPFQISSDPAFIWLGEKHREALATLKYGILDNKGFMLLTGDVGTGKTTLIHTLIESLGDDILYAFVPDPVLELNDFFNYIARAFDIDKEFATKGQFILHFGHFLEEAYKRDTKVLLLIDESQLLTQKLLEEIRLLSNIQKDGNHLLNIFFVGQNEFNAILDRPENRAVTQRLTLNYHLGPLNLQETQMYIRHRLQVAGTTQQLFSSSAVQEIHTYSEGLPRRINILCDHCLLTGFVQETEVIDGATVIKCADDLKLHSIGGIQQPHHQPVVPQAPVRPIPATIKQTPIPPRPIAGNPRRVSSYLNPLLLLLIVLIAILLLVPGDFISNIKVAGSHLFPIKQVFKERPASDITTTQAVSAPENDELNSTEPVRAGDDNVVPEIGRTETAPMTDDAKILGLSPAPEQPAPKVSAGPQGTPDSTETTEGKATDISSAPDVAGDVEVKETKLKISAAVITEPRRLDFEQPLPSEKKPVEKVLPLPEETLVMRFDRNATGFYDSEIFQLEEIAKSVKAHPFAVIVISGYTDSIGAEAYNQTLSLYRANMIKSFLLGYGLQGDRIRVEGHGSKKPIASNATEEGRSINRRVEIDVVAR